MFLLIASCSQDESKKRNVKAIGKSIIDSPEARTFSASTKINGLLSHCVSTSLYAFKNEKSKYGFKDAQGNIKIEPIYDDAENFTITEEPYSEVSFNGKYGIINNMNQVIVPFQYDFAYRYSDTSDVVILGIKYRGNRLFDINNKQFITGDKEYAILNNFDNLYFLVSTGSGRDTKIGILKRNGDFLIDIGTYDEINFNPHSLYSRVRRNELYGICHSETGKEIIPPSYLDIDQPSTNLEYRSARKTWESPTCLINNKEECIFSSDYNIIRHYGGNSLILVRKNLFWGYINQSYYEVIKCQYDKASKFRNGHAYVQMNDLYYFIDKKGLKGKDTYSYISYIPSELGHYLVEQNDHCGILDINLNEIIPIKYKALYGKDFEQKYSEIRFHENNKWGFIDDMGNVIIPAKYSEALGFNLGKVSIASSEKKFGLINKKGEYIVNPIFDRLHNISGDHNCLFEFRIGETIGVVNDEGNIFGLH